MRFAAVAVAWAVVAVLAEPAAGATSCGQRVLGDWSDDGRIEELYELHCYEDALEALPADLRDYTNAAEVIERAMTSALRARRVAGQFTGEGEAPGAASPTRASSLPLAPVAAGAGALALVLAGVLAYLVRRRGAA